MNPLRFGKLTDEPWADYQAAEAFGIHDLSDLSPYPLRFYLKQVAKTLPADKDSPALTFGRALHALALEGEEVFEGRYVCAPEGIDRRTTVGKAAWAAFQAESAGREIIAREDYDTAWAMVRAIRAKPGAAALFAKGLPEVTFRHAMKHYALQSRVDWFNETPEGGGPPMIVDLKSIDCLEEFDRQFEKFGYYRQAAMYRAVVSSVMKLEKMEPQFVFVVVEKQAPHQVAVRTPDAQSLDLGWQEVQKDLTTLRTCLESGVWPGEPDEPRAVSLPAWKTKEQP